jgi:RNA polymerase sigma factor (sigma-70 family)
MQSSPPETRASLILRLKNAEDVAAWNDFVAIYAPVIFRVACRHGFQIADAENLIQEVLLSISRALPQWLLREDRGSFRAWLLKIARNEVVDMLTRRATRPIDIVPTGLVALIEIGCLANVKWALLPVQWRRSRSRVTNLPLKQQAPSQRDSAFRSAIDRALAEIPEERTFSD